MKNVFGFRLLLFALIILAAACSKKDTASLSSQNSQTANNESIQESSSAELDDMATSALNSNSSAGSRVAATTDGRFCTSTTIVFSSVTSTSGTATINFGTDGCTDANGNVRKGQIVVSWSGGKWWNKGAQIVIEPVGYSINGIAISGQRTITNTDFTLTASSLSLSWTVAADHTFTWSDKSTATRDVNMAKTWTHTATEDTYTVSAGPTSNGTYAATGTNRYGDSYVVNITSPLIYLGSCVKANKVFLPVSGIKTILDANTQKTFTLDFGNSTCDESFTVTVDGVTVTLTAKNDGTVQ
jgi:hypothetical protein